MGIHNLVDKAIVSAWPRVQYYRDLGVDVVHDREMALHPGTLSLEAQTYLTTRNVETAFRAYWTVPAQFCLIQVDVFGEDAHTPAARKGVQEIGRVFQWLKAADDFVDEQGDSRVRNLENLYTLLQAEREPATGAESYILEVHKSFDRDTKNRLNTVYQNELRQCNATNDEERYRARAEVGKTLGRSEAEILKMYVEGLPDSITPFLELTGVGGAYFDDFKDFDLDKNKGYGYETNMRRKLLSGFATNLTRAMRMLTFQQARRECAFLALGGLYQVRELIGMQERT